MPVKLGIIDRWKVLHREWMAAETKARKAQSLIRLAFEQERLGIARPIIDSVGQADKLQWQADLLRVALDAYVESTMKLPK